MNSSVDSACVLLLLTFLTLLAILSVHMETTQPITAQLDNSTNIEEEKPVSRPIDTVNVISMLLFVIALFSISMTARKKKKWKIRNVIALVILFVSIGAFISSLPDRPFKNTNVGYDDGYRALAIFLVIIALAIAFIPKRHRTEKSIPWKKRNDIRRQLSIQVRDQVLKAQKQCCANCGLSISPPLVHYDHVDGNHFNIEISNCQALCPNCHSLKTDDDRRNQRRANSFKPTFYYDIYLLALPYLDPCTILTMSVTITVRPFNWEECIMVYIYKCCLCRLYFGYFIVIINGYQS